jgi:hypothetical protein
MAEPRQILALLVSLLSWSCQAETAPDLLIDVAPAHAISRGVRTDHMTSLAAIPVVMMNNSNGPLRVWSHGVSEGANNLVLQLTDDNGKVYIISNNQTFWWANSLSFEEVPPGATFVFLLDVWDNEFWKGDPSIPKWGSFTVTARFEIPEDANSQRLGIWTGKVQSPQRSFAFDVRNIYPEVPAK